MKLNAQSEKKHKNSKNDSKYIFEGYHIQTRIDLPSRFLASEFNFADPVVFLKFRGNNLRSWYWQNPGDRTQFSFQLHCPMLSLEDIAASLTILRIIRLSFVLSGVSLTQAISVSLPRRSYIRFIKIDRITFVNTGIMQLFCSNASQLRTATLLSTSLFAMKELRCMLGLQRTGFVLKGLFEEAKITLLCTSRSCQINLFNSLGDIIFNSGQFSTLLNMLTPEI